MFALTRLHIVLCNVTSEDTANSAQAMQPPPAVRDTMRMQCVFASLRKEISYNFGSAKLPKLLNRCKN